MWTQQPSSNATKISGPIESPFLKKTIFSDVEQIFDVILGESSNENLVISY